MPAVSTEGGADFMLPPHSDHQSECLLHCLFLGCVSRGLLGFSHEDIIDFDICAHGSHSVVVCIDALYYTHSSQGRQSEVRTELPKAHRESRCARATELSR